MSNPLPDGEDLSSFQSVLFTLNSCSLVGASLILVHIVLSQNTENRWEFLTKANPSHFMFMVIGGVVLFHLDVYLFMVLPGYGIPVLRSSSACLMGALIDPPACSWGGWWCCCCYIYMWDVSTVGASHPKASKLWMHHTFVGVMAASAMSANVIWAYHGAGLTFRQGQCYADVEYVCSTLVGRHSMPASVDTLCHTYSP